MEKGTELLSLKQEENKITRQLWEEVFEDSKAYLDFYYRRRGKNSRVYVIRKDNQVISMLHMNPYQMQLGSQLIDTHYIVGVATKEEHRGQGHMGQLIKYALRESYERKEPLTFLMPVAEAIYQPYDFFTVYHQNKQRIHKKDFQKGNRLTFRPASSQDAEMLAAYANKYLNEHYQIYVKRSREYFETMMEEQKSDKGHVLLFYKEERFCGYCFTSYEVGPQAWEIVTEPGVEEAVLPALFAYFGDVPEIRINAFPKILENEGTVFLPLIMMRIVNLQSFITALRVKEERILYVHIEDTIIRENNGFYKIFLGQEESYIEEIMEYQNGGVQAAQIKQEEYVSIGELTGLLLGKKSKYEEFRDIFINEIV